MLQTAPRNAAGVAALLMLASFSAHAEGMRLSVHYGEDGSEYHGTGVSLRFPPWWEKPLGSRWTASLSAEAEFTRFHYRGDAVGARAMSEVGGIGIFRVGRESGWLRPYAEAGLGVALFSRQDLGEKIFSTAFQFSEHLGLGLGFAQHWSAGYRYSHYSNADIQIPNKGLDVQQLTIGYSF